MGKVLVVGWDGATWSALKPWVDEGLLPNLKKLMDGGQYGSLESVMPPVSPVAWPSFATGCNPGRHGIFGFQQLKKGTTESFIPLGHNIREKKLWQFLSENGLRSVVMNVQLTYPPDGIDGVIVSGVMAPEITSNDKEIQRWLEGEGYVIEGRGHMDTPKKPFVEDLYRVTDKRVDAALKLMGRVDWDFFMLLISGTDRIQHCLWGDMEDGVGMPDAIRDYYVHIDGLLGQLIEAAGADLNIVMSDHGFCRMKKRVHINHFLEERGFIVVEETPENKKARRTIRMSGLLKKTGASKLIVRALQVLGREPGKISPPRITLDYEKSTAYTGGYYTGQIYVNPRLEKEDYEHVQESLLHCLCEDLIDPVTKRRVVKKAWRKQDLYHGGELDAAPDVLLLPEEGYWITGGFTYPSLFEHVIRESGRHHMQGIYVMQGAGFNSLKPVDAHLVDLAPTILKYFGLSADMDGAPIKPGGN